MFFFFYRLLGNIFLPFLGIYALYRLCKKKEEKGRIKERFGFCRTLRPKGKLLWVHAASIGESLAVLPLIKKLLEHHPMLHIMVSSCTVSSAILLQKQLPERAFHHYLPYDTEKAVNRFLTHYTPDGAIWVESELWPVLLHTLKKTCPVILLNGTMSEISYKRWKTYGASMCKKMLMCFSHVFVHTTKDKERFEALGDISVSLIDNIKYTAKKLAYDENKKEKFSKAIGHRPCWVAASTHAGEEEIIASIHQKLQISFPHLLTIIVPRHPERGELLEKSLSHTHACALHSKVDSIAEETEIYIADTLGELGLWYSLAPIAFVGASFVPIGGHNPLEPLRMGCVTIIGPYMFNLEDIVAAAAEWDILTLIHTEKEMIHVLEYFLNNPSSYVQQQENTKQFFDRKDDVLSFLVQKLPEFFPSCLKNFR